MNLLDERQRRLLTWPMTGLRLLLFLVRSLFFLILSFYFDVFAFLIKALFGKIIELIDQLVHDSLRVFSRRLGEPPTCICKLVNQKLIRRLQELNALFQARFADFSGGAGKGCFGHTQSI